MARIILTAVATGMAALLLHFQPWVPTTQSQETYRATADPGVNLPSVPAPSQPAKPVEDPLPPAPSQVPPVVSVSATCPQEPVPAAPPGPLNLPPPPAPSKKDFVPPPPPMSSDALSPPTTPELPAIPPQPTAGSPPIPPQVPQSPPALPGPAPLNTPPDLGDKLPSPPPSRDKIRAKAQIPEPPPAAPMPPIGYSGSTPFGPTVPPDHHAPVKEVKPLTSPWSFHLEIVDGKNLITAKVGKTVQFRVVCESLKIHSPAGSISASGKVKITSQALEANCETLTIQLHDEAVLLAGAAQMKCQHEGKELDLRSDSFSLKLSDIQGTPSKTAAPSVDPLFGAHNTSASPQAESARPPIITVTPGPIVK